MIRGDLILAGRRCTSALDPGLYNSDWIRTINWLLYCLGDAAVAANQHQFSAGKSTNYYHPHQSSPVTVAHHHNDQRKALLRFGKQNIIKMRTGRWNGVYGRSVRGTKHINWIINWPVSVFERVDKGIISRTHFSVNSFGAKNLFLIGIIFDSLFRSSLIREDD